MATRASISEAVSDEILFQNDGVSLCLLVNRRARTMRVIDFRSGPHPAKRLFVMSLARREGIERVYTLVERDESAAWARLGFQREGNIPAFYKRSDAFILGSPVSREPERSDESGVRQAVSDRPRIGEDERVYQHARRIAKDVAENALPVVRVQAAREADFRKGLASALRSGRALTGFEPFGRDIERISFSCTARGGFSLLAAVELQPCFNNAFLELLTAPRSDKEAMFTVSAVRQLCDELFEREVVCCFSLSPADDPALAAAYVVNGFRRTGLLSGHLLVGRRRVDAFLWSRKLAQPTDG
jgi:hypothetical protein